VGAETKPAKHLVPHGVDSVERRTQIGQIDQHVSLRERSSSAHPRSAAPRESA